MTAEQALKPLNTQDSEWMIQTYPVIVRQFGVFYCPCHKHIMTNYEDYTTTENEDCKYNGVKYKLPTVALTPIINYKKQENYPDGDD